MTKAEQEWSLIEVLEYCKNRESGNCVSCPYPGLDCAIDIAIAKLESQEPRVMTEQVPACVVETFTECEKTQQPECEECRRPAREAVEQYFTKLCMNKNSKEANDGNSNDT